MIIKELNLIGFGKFNNKIITLEDGINIIYGENEGGKTTIHNFINGMFYGFLKPYAKRTIYEEEHGKYEPWSNSKYSGIIKFSYDGKNYRIERNFTKGNESTSVFLEDTGEDITNYIDSGNSGRVLQPGFHFFGFNDAVYSNTISIRQLNSETEDSLAKEVRDKLVNVTTTLDDELSVKKAIEGLDKYLKEIGTIRATTSIYGRTYEELNKLKETRKRILGFKEEYEKTLELDTILDRQLEDKEKNLKNLGKKLENAMAIEKNKIYNESIELINNIKGLENKIQDYKKYKELSMEDYSKGISLSNDIKYINSRNKELKTELVEVQNKLKGFENGNTEDLEGKENLNFDYLKYEELEEGKNNLIYNNNDNEIQFLKRDYESNIKTKSNYSLALITSIILSIGSIVLSYFLSNYWVLSINGLLIPSFIFIFSKMRRVKGLLIRIQSHIEDFEKNERIRREQISSIEEKQSLILEKYNVSTKLEFKKLNDDFQFIIYSNKEKIALQRENNKKRQDILNKIKKLEEEKERKAQLLSEILKNNISKNLEEFKIGLENKEIYEDALVEIENKKALLKKTLGKYTIEVLEKDFKLYNKDLLNNYNVSSEELKMKIDNLNREISNLKIEKRGIEERLKTLNDEISQLVEIDEEIHRKEALIEKLDNKKDSIELAKYTIELLSKDIHRQFAPTINKKVGKIIEGITGGKYKSVKIDDKLEIGIVNPITREIIDINSLSGGTIDQLYFSLRFGIIDSIKKKGLPLILDDCFIQYDNNRLENMMKFLVKESKNRQIILFTCHKRETQILNDMNVDYNLIELT